MSDYKEGPSKGGVNDLTKIMKQERPEPPPPMSNCDVSQLDPVALEAARKAVEAVLISFRDSRVSVMGGNGFVIREKDGQGSHIMRLSSKQGLEIGIRAYLAERGPK